MMEVYIMKGQMDTQYGQILIDTDVIATYAGSVAAFFARIQQPFPKK